VSDAVRPTLTVEDDCLVVQVPLQIKRRRGRKEIIGPGGSSAGEPVPARRNEPLVMIIARAHRWRDVLEAGRYATIRELAGDLGVSHSYVARILRLTTLAPDIVEAIVDGTEPGGLSLEKLYRAPMVWEEQRRVLGFPPGSSTPSQEAGRPP
jgi:AraC-like DNA-binding protein